ncbi:restriction endonuclease subunit S [Ornithobacterium rhinotracheale]|uniref:restriction endonuclease subunit S n=1 Tax=Ornithobacterium rhinotracheale TaxID=28251 RepID=UPI00129CA5AE|nr:restriction endonuclease subunit S [Ornithobacterium rhinotracheale]MRI62722.1 restriction endonuclease subunit S [Ornithobacterium rhinotracheale]
MKKVELGDVCEFYNGYAFKSSNYVNEKAIRIIRITNVQKGKVVDNEPKFYPKESLKFLSKYLISEGDILMSLTGNVGRVGRFPKELLPAYLNQRVCKIVSKSSALNSNYLFYFFNRDSFEKMAINNAAGIAQLNLSTKWLEKLEIPLPDLATQQAIVKKLDAAQKLCDLSQALIEKYESLSQSLFLEMFGDPVTNPKGWEVKTIEDLVSEKKNSIKRGPFGGALKKEIFVEEGYLVYEQYHALNNDFDFERYFIDEEKFNELKSFEVEEGDIIISCSGVYLGKLSIVPKGAKRGIINQALLKLTLNQNVMKNIFFVYVFSYKRFKEKYFASTRGAGIPNFPPMSDFKKFKFITPPIELQNQFAANIAEIERQKALAEQELAKSQRLFAALLQESFS